MSQGSRFVFSPRGYSTGPAPFIGKIVLSQIELPCHLCQIAMDYIYIYIGLFLNSLLCPITLYSILIQIPCCLDYCSFIESLKIRYPNSSTFVLNFQNCLAVLDTLHVHIHCRINLSISTEETAEIFIGIALEI